MGEIADSIINGEICQYCGKYLEPGQTIHNGTETDTMPLNGVGYGIPISCMSCHED